MNPHTGEVRVYLGDEKPDLGFVPVPEHLHGAARQVLGGKPSAHVSLTSGGKLSKFAADQRRKARNKRKVAKRSRQRNR